jgi:hypothetical protein
MTAKKHKTKICKQCGKEFREYDKANGVSPKTGRVINMSRRSFCLECSPYGQYIKNKKPIIDGRRECNMCRQFKLLSEFRKSKTGRVCVNCNDCDKIRISTYNRTLKQKAVDYLGGKCSVCGYNRCMRSLVFHHKDPTQKEFSLARRKCLNWEDTKKELDKCALLCANCHGEIHDSSRAFFASS